MTGLIILIILAMVALAIFVVSDSFTKLLVKKNSRKKEKLLRKGEDASEVEIPVVMTEKERIKAHMPSKAGATIGDTAVEIIRREKVFSFFKQLASYAFLIVVAFFIIIPFYWMFVVSLKTPGEIDLISPTLFPGSKAVVAGKVVDFPIAISNFKDAMIRLDGVTLMANTIWVGICSTAGTLVTTVMAAFAFSRIKFWGRELLFTAFLATMMIPGEMMVITNFITVSQMGIKGTFTSLIIPFLISVYYIYLLRQNFKQIPNELYYAAKVDGTSDLKYLFKVMIPIATPTLITITILKMMGSWNAYAWPKLMAAGSKDNIQLITSGLRESFTDTEGRTAQGLQMAASTIVTVPLLLVFIFLRKYIMRGVSRSGIKG